VVAPILVAVGAVLLVLALLVVLVGIGRIVLRYLTRVSLIRMVDQYEETGEELSVATGLKLGWSRASFQLFLVNLIIMLPIALLMIALIVPVIALAVLLGLSESVGAASGVGVILGVILILTLIPIILIGVALSIVVGPWTQVAYRACAIDGLGALDAVRSAFGLIRRNLGPTALQWLLLVGMGIAWRIALIPANVLLVGLAFLIGGLPGALVGGIGWLIGGWPWGLGAGLFVFVPLFILMVALPNLALSTAAAVYHSTVWTLAYRELKVIDTAAQDIAV
jgi:hypothetical protein